MARPSSETVPVMEQDAARAKKAAATALRTLSGPYQASFDGSDGHGHPAKGLTFCSGTGTISPQR